MSVPLGLLSAVLLVCLGLLLGATWTDQVLQYKHRLLAEQRRRLTEEQLALDAARQQQRRCARCARPLSEQNWYVVEVLRAEPPDDVYPNGPA